MSAPAPIGDIQRIVVAGAGSNGQTVTYVLLRVTDPSRARRWLGRLVTDAGDRGPSFRLSGGDLAAEERHGTRAVTLSIGLTARGLSSLGVDDVTLRTFPLELRQGPHPRSSVLGDVGVSRPEDWIAAFAPASFAELHVVASLWEPYDGGAGCRLAADLADDRNGFAVLTCFRGARRDDGREPFGFQDGARQPVIEGVGGPTPHGQAAVPLGEFVVGHPTQFGGAVRRWSVPGRDDRGAPRIGINGSFAALRVMAQDVALFREWTARHGRLAAERMCGVTFDGRSLGPGEPAWSHVARCNPHQHRLVSRGHHRRRLIRRGMPYAPESPPEPGDGLIGLFICANLAAQYEGVLGEWMHQGIHDPALTGTNDPLVGYQGAAGPQFVRTRGVAYLFLPSRTGLATLARS